MLRYPLESYASGEIRRDPRLEIAINCKRPLLKADAG